MCHAVDRPLMAHPPPQPAHLVSAIGLTVQEGLVGRVREVGKAAVCPALTVVLHQKVTSPLQHKKSAMDLIVTSSKLIIADQLSGLLVSNPLETKH